MSTLEPLKIVLLGDASSVNVQSWRTGLERAGCEVHFLSLHVNSASKSDKHLYPIPMIHLPPPLNKFQYFLAVPYTRRLIAQIKPDIVLAYYVSGYGTLGAFCNFHPIVQITAGGDILFSLENFLMKRLVHHNLMHAELITSWSPYMTESTKKIGISEEKIFTLPRGIDLSLFAIDKTPFPNNHEVIRIISTRALEPIYHVDKVIKAMAHLRDRGIKVLLTIVGDGPECQLLRNLTTKLGLDSVIQFTGKINNKDLPILLTQQDIYISLVDEFGVSASLLEAMAARVFPIVFDNTANRYWIQPEHNGLLVKSLEPSHIAAVIQQAISNLALRQQAWELNPSIIKERADLNRNTATYADLFRKIAKDYAFKKSTK